MSKQKSIEDYRNAVKLLKLKVIKLQKINEELSEKLREQGISITPDDKNQGPLTNQNVMQTFGRSCKRLGLTPEMLFRAADNEASGAIKVEDFRLFMTKLRLGLNQAQVTLIVRILDEDCSGIVKKEGTKKFLKKNSLEYYDCLQAYNINEEKSTTGTRTYGQTSLLKYAKLLLQLQMSPEDSWTKMDTQNKGTIIPQTFSAFAHAIDSQGSMNEKEIVATYNHIDLDKQGTLQRAFYEQEVRKAMKACAADLGVNSSALLGQTGQQFNLAGMTGAKPTTQLNVPNTGGVVQGTPLDQSQVMATEDKRSFNVNPKMIKDITSKMQA